MRIGNYQFRPRLIPTVAVILILPILVRLGFWQISRAQEKREIIAEQQAKMALPPKNMMGQKLDAKDLQYRRLQFTGRFEDTYQIFIDNKVSRSRVGYDVVTPFRIGGTQKYVLVNRGWVAMGKSRADLPQIDTPKQQVTLDGIARYKTRDVVSFGDGNRSNQGWPAVVRWVDIQSIAKQTNLDLVPYMLLLDPDSQYGFVRRWSFVNMTPAKHLSYAVQWFALASVLVLIYLIVNLKRNSEIETQDDR